MSVDERILLLPDTEDPVEIRRQFSQLLRTIEAENFCNYHDDSGFSAGQADRGRKQLFAFVAKHRSHLPHNYEELMERYLY